MTVIREASDENSSVTVVAFYTDFAKAFDWVAHNDLLKKKSGIGVAGCFLENLSDFLEKQTQHVNVENSVYCQLEITGGVPQDSLVAPLSFCFFKIELPE